MTFGAPSDFETSYEIMAHAYKNGINFFDNAEAYGDGKSETIMGQCIKKGVEEGIWSREDLVISTKIFWSTKSVFAGGSFGPNDIGLSRKHIVEGTKASLKRFDQDYVDLIFCHRPDPRTPIEETVRAMNYVIDQGWAFYWGTSEWNAHDVIEACEIADRLGLARPVMDQPQYSIFERSRVEYDFVNLYEKYKYGLTTWSPLASGILTGKYSKSTPEGSRLSVPMYKAYLADGLEDRIAKADKLAEVAKEIGATLAQFSIAWVAANKNVSTVMLGATSTKQLDENLKALEFIEKITPEIRAKVDEIVQFQPVVIPSADAFVHQLRSKLL
jgi:voltage-dependent potassium channel beta subunit